MFADEKAVWRYVKPRLASGWRWSRVEAAMPLGIPDVLGMSRGCLPPRTAWLELKEGPPRPSALRPAQREWLAAAWADGHEAWIAFGTPAGLLWFRDLALKHPLPPPDFFLD